MVLSRFEVVGAQRPGLRWLLAAMVGCVLMVWASSAAASSSGWVVTPEEASELIRAGEEGVTILDVRSKNAFQKAHIKGAQRVTWQEFSRESGSDHGELLQKDSVLRHRLRKVGVSNAVPVLVVGDPLKGWGEEGRIVWMLRALGHKEAALVDGGYDALIKPGDLKVEEGMARAVPAGDFEIKRTQAFSITREEVKALLDEEGALFLDTREAREFSGETPYGESRGGHLPGAHHLYFSDLLDKQGRILAPDKLEQKLEAMGVTKRSQPIIAYCTGGIRSAWVVAILQDAGYVGAKNYAGSMWQWSASDASSYPLEEAREVKK